MKSLRLRLALITTAISGIVLIVFGLLGWGLTYRMLRESIDLRMAVPLDRTVGLLHPRADFDRIFDGLETAFMAEVREGKRLMLALDRNGAELYRNPRTDWTGQLDPQLLDQSAPIVPLPGGAMPPSPPRAGEEGNEERPGGPGASFDEDLDRFLDGLPPRRRGLPGDGEPGRPLPPRPVRHEGGNPPRLAFRTLSIDGTNWRLGVIEDRGYRLILGTELSEFEGEIRRVRTLFFSALPLCLGVIGLGGWFVARRALRPVDLIAATASRVTAQGLDLRVPEEAQEYRELSHLVEVLNGMMARLEQSFQHATRFSADVSHELKTPLAVMQAAVQTALKECQPGSPEEQHLLTVSQEAERLKRITRSLMLLAQADSGQLALRRELVDLSREVEAICEDAEILCEKSELHLTSEVEPGLVLQTDPVLLRQALQNLVGNAIKYNRPGGEVICRLFRRKGNPGSVIFSVSNTGSGIPEDERDRIFQRFYRIDKARSREIDGFGLGLNLAWEIVRAMGGELRLAESNAEITRFEVRWETENTVGAINREERRQPVG